MPKQPLCSTEHCHDPKDRTEWGAGPWNGEPDRIDFKANGFQCFIHRNHMGSWCGYVGVRRRHPAFGHHYDDVNVSVHGGLTFAGKCGGHLCHPGGVTWWLGFDCGHFMDYMPKLVETERTIMAQDPTFTGFQYFNREHQHYWTAAETIAETTALAKQLSSVGTVRFSRWIKHHAKDRQRQWNRARRALDKAERIRQALKSVRAPSSLALP